jgi:hypothetical protein
MSLLSRALTRTLVPGASALQRFDADMLLTCGSSMHTTAWLLLMVVETLCM